MKKKEKEIKEEVTSVEEETKPKKKGILGKIILALIFLVIAAAIVIVILAINNGGFGDVLGPKLSKEDTRVFDLYWPELKKYENCVKGYECQFQLYYLDGVDDPIINLELRKKNRNSSEDDYAIIFYIKDDKVVKKEFEAYSRVSLSYNLEEDKADYYVIVSKSPEGFHWSSQYMLLKDIVTENPDGYNVTFTTCDKYLTTSKHGNQKTWVTPNMALFVDEINFMVDGERHDQTFNFIDGANYFKKSLKKAIKSKVTLKDLFGDSQRTEALERLEYNVKPGTKIIGNYEACSTSNSSSNGGTNSNSGSGIGTGTEKSKEKCNSGYVYVSDDKKCYNSKDEKAQINRCQSGEDEIDGADCGKSVSMDKCSSGEEGYQEINGKCYDQSTLHPKSIECPSGYEILFGEYGGQTFNGGCYKRVNPNY